VVHVLHWDTRRIIRNLRLTMKPMTLTCLAAIAIWTVPSAEHQTPSDTAGIQPAASADANLMDSEGRSVGQVHLRQASHGVLLKLDLKNATPGVHGLHIHDVGRCDPPSFASAGNHFNPTNRQHGFLNSRGQHAGDLPNIEVPASTEHSSEYFLADVTLNRGPLTLLDTNGSAIVVHAGMDDYGTDPAGESGARLACGPIVRTETK
jgi:Cu-Zn family superoxide dismutase